MMYGRSRIKLSVIINNLIIICTFVMMGYFRIFPFGAKGEIKIHLIVVVLGVIMAFIITVYRKKNSNVYGNRAFYMYLTGYILIMLYSSLYTFFVINILFGKL